MKPSASLSAVAVRSFIDSLTDYSSCLVMEIF